MISTVSDICNLKEGDIFKDESSIFQVFLYV